MKMYTSGFTEEQRNTIREDLTRFTQERASLLGFPPEAAVQEIRYWQQSNPNWSTNPNQTAKRSSFEHHQGICLVCGGKISSIKVATFHHLKRGVPNLPGPQNMIPLHRDGGCHEKLHNAPPDSRSEERRVGKECRS